MCGELQVSIVARSAHEVCCRGSAEANRTCRWCGRDMDTAIRMQVHEKVCPPTSRRRSAQPERTDSPLDATGAEQTESAQTVNVVL